MERPVREEAYLGVATHSSQAWLPRASGRALICLRVSSSALLRRPSQDWQRIESLAEERRSAPFWQKGHTREPGLDANDEPFIISCPFPLSGDPSLCVLGRLFFLLCGLWVLS